MMKSEFCELTGMRWEDVSPEEYADIETAYYEFPGNKQEFCREWMDWKKRGAWAMIRTLIRQREYWAEACADTEKERQRMEGRIEELAGELLAIARREK